MIPDAVTDFFSGLSPTVQFVLFLLLVGMALAGYSWVRQQQMENEREMPAAHVVFSEWVKALLFGDDIRWRAAQWVGLVVAVAAFLLVPDDTWNHRPLILWVALAAMRYAVLARKRRFYTRQMFEVASSVCKYPKGSALTWRQWIRVKRWRNVTEPSVTEVYYPPGFDSDNPIMREKFERQWNGSVTAEHEWLYDWQSAANHVKVTPTPKLPTMAPYEVHDTEWNKFPMGYSADGLATWDVLKYPHMLLAGPTGSGKSVAQRVLVVHALRHPEWEVYGIDPKAVELFWLKGRDGVIEVTTELFAMKDTVDKVWTEMTRRQRLMERAEVNHFTKLDPRPKAVLLVVDEVTEFLSLSKLKTEEAKEEDELRQEVTAKLMSIARLGRAMGIHMLLATQRPDASNFPGNLKNNLDARFAAGRMDKIPSQMVLDNDEATKLPNIKGRSALRLGGDTFQMQSFLLESEDVDKVLGTESDEIDPEEQARLDAELEEAVNRLETGAGLAPPTPPTPPAPPAAPKDKGKEPPRPPKPPVGGPPRPPVPPGPPEPPDIDGDGDEPAQPARPPRPPVTKQPTRPTKPTPDASEDEDDGSGRPAKRSMDPEAVDALLAELDALPGLGVVADQVRALAKRMKVDAKRRDAGFQVMPMNMHLRFEGPPGTGKTTVARLIGRMYRALGLLAKGHVEEVSRPKLVGQYVGHTAGKADEVIDKALDGVLFIDEAYSLVQGGENDFGHEAITQILQRMENDRDRLAVIVAGYPVEMQEFVDSNPGLQSRFGKTITFPNYTPETLVQIANTMLADADYNLSEQAQVVLMEGLQVKVRAAAKDFGNAREVRSLIDEAITAQSGRIADDDEADEATLSLITDDDIIAALAARGIDVERLDYVRSRDDATPPVGAV